MHTTKSAVPANQKTQLTLSVLTTNCYTHRTLPGDLRHPPMLLTLPTNDWGQSTGLSVCEHTLPRVQCHTHLGTLRSPTELSANNRIILAWNLTTAPPN